MVDVTLENATLIKTRFGWGDPTEVPISDIMMLRQEAQIDKHNSLTCNAFRMSLISPRDECSALIKPGTYLSRDLRFDQTMLRCTARSTGDRRQ